jgi:hypothetical protein
MLEKLDDLKKKEQMKGTQRRAAATLSCVMMPSVKNTGFMVSQVLLQVPSSAYQ